MDHHYDFVHRNGEFVLGRYERDRYHRATGESTRHSIDFTAGEMTVQDGNEYSGEVTARKTVRFVLDSVPTLRTLGEPFKWTFRGLEI